ncbi:NAD(P)-dependent oxidoreductase [Methylobacterium sp. WL8]|uniref:NAD-dependent epimerase/dehydratase family protein n=1 Tax=Methylobacterium sp. WL8 TaxID=2603899 RepID=UPI0011CB40D1|nr:NAD(P)-dependent oxidoreductase [Methylobacterium sp. WL8]TXN75900.1 NAD(P)-dependent oxidoreductase [Methylobacterium sp. WL8]
MRVLFTGASSFTGVAFVQALVASGHSVAAAVRGTEHSYVGLKRDRLAQAAAIAEIHWFMPFGSPRFIELASQGDFDILCHHAAQVVNYRSPDFDVIGALSDNAFALKSTLETLKAGGLKSVVLTGSVFESGEGAGSRPLRSFSPYGLSKALTSQVFEYWCDALGLQFGKFVIPNPFGPYEEPRFCNYLFRTWKSGAVARVNTPNYVRDNIPVDLLSLCYSSFCNSVNTKSGTSHCAPSGYVESQGDFSFRMARELAPRLRFRCDVELAIQTDLSEPMTRINLDRALGCVSDWNEERFWDMYAAFLLSSKND